MYIFPTLRRTAEQLIPRLRRITSNLAMLLTMQWGRRILINDQRLFLLTDQMIYKMDELIIIASFHNVMSQRDTPLFGETAM